MQDHRHLVHENTHFAAFPVDIDYIPEELKIKAKDELHEENENTRVQSLKSLRTLLKGELHLQWQDDDQFLIAFLRARKYDVKRAFNLVKGMYTTFGKHERVYYNMTFDRIKFIMEENSYSILRHRNTDGSIVFYFHFANWKPDAISAEEHLAVVSFGVIIEVVRNSLTQISGLHVIADFKDISLRQLMSVCPYYVVFTFELLMNAAPIRLRGFHVINENCYFRPILTVAKKFFSKKMFARIHVHGKDYKNLHKFIDPRILPAELDGMQLPFSNEEWRVKMEASFDYLKHVLSFGYKKYLKNTQKKHEI